MQTPETPDDHSPSIPLQAGQETVIKFVLNGPMYADRPAAAETVQDAAPRDVADLRRRVAVLERALVDAEARLQALARAIGAVFPASVNFVARSTDAAPAAPAAPALAHDGAWTLGGLGEPSTYASPGEPGGTLAAAAAAASFRYREPEPLAVAAAPEPPSPDRPDAPKVNGLRRMISVLKHD